MYTSLSDISKNAKPLKRLQSGFPVLDELLGQTVTDEGLVQEGFVIGGMYYIFGEPGVGKTRLTIQIMENLALEGKTSLVCQGEANPDAFAAWCADKPQEVQERIFLTTDMNFDELMSVIKELRPSFIVIDSANMIQGIAGLKDLQEKYIEWRQTVADVDSVCVLIGQLNQDGTLKGDTTIPHLVDCVATLKRPKIKRGPFKVKDTEYNVSGTLEYSQGHPEMLNRLFRFQIPTKNRYGQSGEVCDFAHTEKGVIYITSTLETDWRKKPWLIDPVELLRLSNGYAYGNQCSDEEYEYVEYEKPNWWQRWLNS